MSIECIIPLTSVDQDTFHAVDQQVMGIAFAVHNSMGRFMDERIYQNEVASRCRKEGLGAEREIRIRVSHGIFSKDYFLDLLVANGVVYELKAVEALASVHDAQLIHYLLLAGLFHGKLINFRPASVHSKFVSTQLTPDKRQQFAIDDSAWFATSPACERLPYTIRALLDDWGAFLALELYREAIIQSLGGAERVIQPVDIVSSRRVLGQQKMCLLDSRTALHVSAVSKHIPTYQTHMERLLNHTRLNTVQWINFNRASIICTTIKKK